MDDIPDDDSMSHLTDTKLVKRGNSHTKYIMCVAKREYDCYMVFVVKMCSLSFKEAEVWGWFGRLK